MTSISVPGLGPITLNPHEVTSEFILKEYKRLMTVIQDIFDRPTQVSENDYQELLQAMQALKELAEKGDSTTPPRTYYLDGTMISKMNTIFALLKNQGLSVDGSSPSSNPLEAMQLLKEFTTTNEKGQTISFLQILGTTTEGVDSSTRSLMDMIRIDFVRRGNEIFLGEMLSLEDAFKLSDEILSTLKNIQSASNQFTIPTPSDFKWPPESASDIPPEIVDDFAKAIYKNDPAAQKKFIEDYNLWKTLPANDSFKEIKSVQITQIVNSYIRLGANTETELLNLTKKHFDTLNPVPNPGLTPPFEWPPTSLFNGEFPYAFPLSEDFLKDMVEILNQSAPGYGDLVLKEYNGMIQGNRSSLAIQDSLIYHLNAIQRINESNGHLENNTQLEQLFHTHFDKLHPANTIAVTGEKLLDYARQLEDFIATLEKPPLNIKRTDENSLAYSLDKVAQGIRKGFEGVDPNDPAAMAQAMSKWIMDNRDMGPAGGGGALQDNLQKAIGAAESLSDTKWNDLQEVKNTYDEFIKCASALIDALKKIGLKFAQGISGH